MFLERQCLVWFVEIKFELRVIIRALFKHNIGDEDGAYFFTSTPMSVFPHSGEQPIHSMVWSFQTFITAIKLAGADDVRPVAILIHNMGSEGQCIFHGLGLVHMHDCRCTDWTFCCSTERYAVSDSILTMTW